MNFIKVGKACDPDHLGGKVLKVCNNHLARKFTMLFQDSLALCSKFVEEIGNHTSREK